MLHPPINSVIFILYKAYTLRIPYSEVRNPMPRGDTNILRTIKKKVYAMLPHRFEIVPLEKTHTFGTEMVLISCFKLTSLNWQKKTVWKGYFRHKATSKIRIYLFKNMQCCFLITSVTPDLLNLNWLKPLQTQQILIIRATKGLLLCCNLLSRHYFLLSQGLTSLYRQTSI